ncbi:MAG: glutathione S-transferase N-terminal domain-containing protein [Dehalococcoidales bacterium]|nr:glutathione S-transferase N-terminal domain-containing protein [Dehalococcoidales bacterium]
MGGKRVSDKKVVVYSTPTCPYCKRVKHYLDQKGISYVEHNVAEDKKAAQEMMRKTKQMGVPVIVIDDDEIVVGFDQTLLDKLLSE